MERRKSPGASGASGGRLTAAEILREAGASSLLRPWTGRKCNDDRSTAEVMTFLPVVQTKRTIQNASVQRQQRYLSNRADRCLMLGFGKGLSANGQACTTCSLIDHLLTAPTEEHLHVFRRASYDQITFVQLGPRDPHFISGPPRPESAFASYSAPRPLSDILEASLLSSDTADNDTTASPEIRTRSRGYLDKSLLQWNQLDGTSVNRLPVSRVPERRSSRSQLRHRMSRFSRASSDATDRAPRTPSSQRQTILPRGQSTSPVRDAATRLNPVSSGMRRIPSRTFVRSVKPVDILDMPEIGHARVSLEMRVPAPLFVGGGTVEGQLYVTVDGGRFKSRQKPKPIISIGRISVDILGVESLQGKKFIFRTLANELIDETHPPPATMVAAPRALSDAYWDVMPSVSVLPFRLDLPVNMGPPPYSSKPVSIKYILCATMTFRILGKQYQVRRSQDIPVLTVHDPEKALVNLPNPLTAEDELLFSFGSHKAIKLTAGVHRQTWVSGIAMFADVHVSNSSDIIVKKIELQLLKVITFFNHSAAFTKVEMADHLRLPDLTDREVIARSILKKARYGWSGVAPHSQEVRTFRLQIPTGLVTVDAGRFFGVRFFLSIRAHSSCSKPLTVQIPLTIIHPNSLDIPPNSVAQVASAIEHRRMHSSSSKHRHTQSSFGGTIGTPYRYSQGQAFAAARKRSIERFAHGTITKSEVDDLEKRLEESPRKMARWKGGERARQSLHIGEEEKEKQPGGNGRRARAGSEGQQGPRLMKSTSGLGFDEFECSDDGNLDDSSDPFTSEGGLAVRRFRSFEEREEGKVRKELSLARKRSKVLGIGAGWRNVALEEAERSSGYGSASWEGF